MPPKIIKATADYIDALTQLHIDGLKQSYAHIATQDYFDTLTHESYAKKWQKWIDDPESLTALALNEHDVPVGLMVYGRLRTPPPGSSSIRPLYGREIYGLYVNAEHQQQGIGRALLSHAASHFITEKQKSMCLWVMEKNRAACGFYDAMGAKRCGKKMTDVGSVSAKEVCYGWLDIRGL
jgi:ribosomal protein S18 acetylase RimI-like enzyme